MLVVNMKEDDRNILMKKDVFMKRETRGKKSNVLHK